MKNHSFKKYFNIIVSVELLFFLAFSILFYRIHIYSEYEIQHDKSARAMNELAKELKNTSDELTQFSRTYVVTNDKQYLENFYKVLAIREGKSPLPIGYRNVYWWLDESYRTQEFKLGPANSLMHRMSLLPYSKKELMYLQIAEKISNDLVQIEIEAFNAMQGLFKDQNGQYTVKKSPDQAYAIQLLFSPQYHHTKHNIMLQIYWFIKHFEHRLNLMHYEIKQKQSILWSYISILSTIFLLFNGYVIFFFHRRVIAPILSLVKQVNDYKENNIIHEDTFFNDELGLLHDTLNSLIDTVEVRTNELKSTLRTNHALLKTLDNYVGYIKTDTRGIITYVSAFFYELVKTSNDLIGKNVNVLKSNRTPAERFQLLWETILKGDVYTYEVENRNFSGGTNWYRSTIIPDVNMNDEMIGFIAFYTNIDDQIHYKHDAEIDHLTHLYNRQKFNTVLEREIYRSQRYKKPLSIIMADIDLFKTVNDTFGHDTGDIMLKEFSALLQENVRQSDIVARWGGEEFIILCPDTDSSGAAALAETLRLIIAENVFSIVGYKTASFGVAQYYHDSDSKTLFLNVDTALYQAKETGRNKVVVYSSSNHPLDQNQ